MSRNIQDWLGVTMNMDIPVAAPITLFPVTEHDHGIVRMPSDLPDQQISLRYIDPRIQRAHDLILDDCVNPFTAWMKVTHTSRDTFIKLLNVSPERADRLLSDDRKLLPTANMILKFCVGVGIHPAHFQPGLAESNYGYDTATMIAITDLLRPKLKKETVSILRGRALPEKDIALCRMACIAEDARYDKWQDNNPRAEDMKMAMRLVASFNPKHGIGRPSTGFNYLSGYHHTDIYFGLKLLQKSLEKGVEDSKEKMRETGFMPANLKLSLLEMAELFYGEDDAEAALDLVIEQIEKFNNGPRVGEDFWNYMGEEILSGNYMFDEMNDTDEYLPFPGLRHDFEICARRHGLDPAQVKEDFNENLQMFMNVREKHLTIMERSAALEDRLNRFRHWVEHASTQNHDIRQYRNGLLIAPFLPPKPVESEIKLLPPPQKHGTLTLRK